MKRTVSLLLLLAMVVFSIAACSPVADDEKEYSLGIGVAMTVSASESKASSTVAAVVTDADGKIVLCRIDTLDSAAKLTADGKPDVKALSSKHELGDNYNMVTYGGAIAEWYEQAEFFESYVEGKTLAEIKAIELGEDGKSTDADITAGCTIAVNDFVAAIVKAIESDDRLTFKANGELEAAVAVNAQLTADAETLSYKTTLDYAAVVSEDGKVVGALIDAAEITLTCSADADNKLTASSYSYLGTKLEQGDDYNMVAAGGAIAEWYEQATTFAKTAIGKDAAALDTLPTENIAGCTITVTTYKAALVKAGQNVR